jgi:hypothetical protein
MVIAACVTPERDLVKTPDYELRTHAQQWVSAERRLPTLHRHAGEEAPDGSRYFATTSSNSGVNPPDCRRHSRA